VEEGYTVANEDHLARLNQGVAAWNQWRIEKKIEPDLVSADLSGRDLSLAHLARAHLSEANLAGAKLLWADLSGSNLYRADLSRAYLGATTLMGTDLSGANLSGAKIAALHFLAAILNGVNFDGATIIEATFADCDLSSVHGLETVEHQGPSTIGIDTLYLSHGNISEAFLRGAGVPDEMITYSKSLVGQPFQYYSCFISHSSRDEVLARRLRTDLRDNRVRCWFAPEDLKIGDEFRSRIDESIQVYDRLLLILSEDSVKSRWVQKEVETAFEKEGKENRIVLFPIRIDEAVMQSEVGWAADIRRQRHIGDFRQWKDHHAYQKAFQRLLRDLKADI
jgi:TIR domain/Pentapeptide repeats (8 copies)